MARSTGFPALLLLLATFCLSAPAHAATGPVGDVFVIVDADGTIQQPGTSQDPAVIGLDAYKAAHAFYQHNPDDFDFITVFSTYNPGTLGTDPAGITAQNNVKGIGTNGISTAQIFDDTAKFGSKGRLQIVVKMQWVGMYPAYDQLDQGTVGTTSVTPIELLAHETGHRWLAWIEYDLGDGVKRSDLRGHGQKGHWSFFLNSGESTDTSSVQYGNVWLDSLGEPGCFKTGVPAPFRKYGPLDQYLMGLRSPDEVDPAFLIVDPQGYGPADSDKVPALSWVKACGPQRYIGIADVIRAEGLRDPRWDRAPHEFHDAFVLVVGKTDSAKTVQDGVAIVDGFRRKWEEFFPLATDGRGTVVASLALMEPPEGAADEGAPEATMEGAEESPPDSALEMAFELDAVGEAQVIDAVPLDATPQAPDLADTAIARDDASQPKGSRASGGCAAGHGAGPRSVVAMLLAACVLCLGRLERARPRLAALRR